MKSIWIEIRKFIKYNFKKVVLYSLILGTIFAAVLLLLNRNNQGPQTGRDNQDRDTSVSYFQYYSEREDGSALTNLSVVREFFTRESVMKDWSRRLDVPLENIAVEGELMFVDDELEDTEVVSGEQAESVRTVDPEDIVNINMYKGDYSHLFTLTVTSQSETKSLEIVEYYFDLIENDEVPFYENKNIYVFQEPQIMENLIRVDDMVEIEIEKPTSVSIVNIVVGYVLSFIIVVGLFVLKSLFSGKLLYSFSYLWDEKQSFLLYSPKYNNVDELQQFIKYPDNNKVYLTEDHLSDTQYKDLSGINILSESMIYQNLTEVNLNDPIDEIILLVVEGETSRKWYREQQRLLSIYNESQIKIVQLNK